MKRGIDSMFELGDLIDVYGFYFGRILFGDTNMLCLCAREPCGTKIKAVCIGITNDAGLQVIGVHSHRRVYPIRAFEVDEFGIAVFDSKHLSYDISSINRLLDQAEKIL